MASDLSAPRHDTSSAVNSTHTDSTQPLTPPVSALSEIEGTHSSNGPSHATDLLSAGASDAIAVDEIVIQPRGGKLALPAIRIPVQSPPPISIPSLDKNAKVGPQNFEKIRILGAGATGRVYLVKSIVRGVYDR